MPRTSCARRSPRCTCRRSSPSGRPTTRSGARRSPSCASGLARATHLVEQLLTLAREEPGVAERGVAPVNLTELARSVVGDHAAIAAARGVDLGMAGAAADASGAPAVVVDGDATALRALVSNLVDNAIRYTPEGGRVDVAVDARDARRGPRGPRFRAGHPGERARARVRSLLPRAGARRGGRSRAAASASPSSSASPSGTTRRSSSAPGLAGPAGEGLAVTVRFPRAHALSANARAGGSSRRRSSRRPPRVRAEPVNVAHPEHGPTRPCWITMRAAATTRWRSCSRSRAAARAPRRSRSACSRSCVARRSPVRRLGGCSTKSTRSWASRAAASPRCRTRSTAIGCSTNTSARFLKRDVQGYLVRVGANPVRWPALACPATSRISDESRDVIEHNATFRELRLRLRRSRVSRTRGQIRRGSDQSESGPARRQLLPGERRPDRRARESGRAPEVDMIDRMGAQRDGPAARSSGRRSRRERAPKIGATRSPELRTHRRPNGGAVA